MQLKSIEFRQYEGIPSQWTLEDFPLRNINLLVGKNATGKSRTLNIIRALGNLVAGDIKLQFKSGNYKVTFDKNGEAITYLLQYEKSRIIREKLILGSDIKLDRGRNGAGKIWADKENKMMEFQAPDTELACVNRRDEKQHPFFEDLYQWGKASRHYFFGERMGRDCLAAFVKESEESQLDLKDTNLVVKIFSQGKKKFPQRFVQCIRSDMGTIGYEINDIKIGSPKSLVFKGPMLQVPKGLILKEEDLPGLTEQPEMSQGMFRALSLIIQLNYSQLASIPSCILIDDIGEGLDYDRSTALIKLLIKKAKKSSVQLIMSTNDRFVMNNVPLEYWSVVHRLSNKSMVYNYENAREKFEDFELTGLSNFDFFASGFYEEGQSKE